MYSQEEALPEFLEPTPKRLRALAWAFAWRYQGSYALCLYVLATLFGNGFTDTPPSVYFLILFIFYAGKALPEAVIKTLYYRPIQGFRMVLVVKDKIINPSHLGWAAFLNPFRALLPSPSLAMRRGKDRFVTPERILLNLYFIYISCSIAFLMFFPIGEFYLVVKYAQISILPLLIGYTLSYVALKRSLNHSDGAASVRLVAHPDGVESTHSELSSAAHDVRAREVLQITWAFFWHLGMAIWVLGCRLWLFLSFFSCYSVSGLT